MPSNPQPRVILVEDHQDTRVMYAEFLGESFDVVLAADGEQALDEMRAHPPDLVITDLALPGIDGFQLIAQMRTDARLRDVPIICLSGYGGDEHDERARRAGCTRVLQKPCMPDRLAEVAADLLRPDPRRSQP